MTQLRVEPRTHKLLKRLQRHLNKHYPMIEKKESKWSLGDVVHECVIEVIAQERIQPTTEKKLYTVYNKSEAIRKHD